MVLQPPAGVLLTAVAAVLYPQAAAPAADSPSPRATADALSSISFTAKADEAPYIPEPADPEPPLEAPVCTPADEGDDAAPPSPADDDAAPAPPVDASNRDGWAPAAHELVADPAPGTWVAKWGGGISEGAPEAAPPAGGRKARRSGKGGKRGGGGGGSKAQGPPEVAGGRRGTKSEEVDDEAVRRQQDWARGTFSEPNPVPLGESLFAWVGMAAQQVAPAALEREAAGTPAAAPSAAPVLEHSSTLRAAALLSRAAATVGGSTHDATAEECEDIEEGEQEEGEETDRLSALRQPVTLPTSMDASKQLTPAGSPVKPTQGAEPGAAAGMTPPRSELNWWCCPEIQVDNAAADTDDLTDAAAPDTRYLDWVRQTRSEDGRRINPYPQELDRHTHSDDISYYDWVKMPSNQPNTPAGARAAPAPATHGQLFDSARTINSINWVAMESVQQGAQFGAVAARKLFAGHTPRHSAIAAASFPSLAAKQQERLHSESDSQADSVTDEESSHDGDSMDSDSSAPSAWGVEGWDAHREAVLKEAQRLVGAANADGGTWRWYANGWC